MTQPPEDPAAGQPLGGAHYGAPQYGLQPIDPDRAPHAASTDVLASSPDDAEPRRRRRGLLVGGAVLAVALVGGGAALAASRLSGGGPQPDEAVPASAVAFIAVDLDPSSGQKIDALRFARKFPDAAKALGGSDDPRQALFEALKKQGDVSGDWAKDVAPWLGDRAGFAVLPPTADGEDPNAIAVLSVKNQDKARAGIAKVSGGKSHCEFTADWAVCSDDAAVVRKAVADAGRQPLSQAKTYAADVQALGERGIARAWVDLARLREAVPSSGAQSMSSAFTGSDLTGRATFALRFDGPTLELSGQAVGTQTPRLSGSAGVEDLPSDTVAAYGFSGADTMVSYMWDRVRRSAQDMNGAAELDDMTAQLKEQYGIAVPGDLAKAMGDRVAIAYGGTSGGAPQVAGRLSGDRATIDKIVAAVQDGSGVNLAKAQGGSTTVLASSQAYADAVAKGGALGGVEAFRRAVPGAKDAQGVLYVDISRLLSQVGDQADLTADQRRQLAALSAVGLSFRQDGDRVSYDVRLTTK